MLIKIRTLRKNRKYIPEDILSAKLRKRVIIGKEHRDGIVVGKWHDKRDVLFLTTRHGINMKKTGKHEKDGVAFIKPEAIINYNKEKDGVDVSDQLASYFSPLRKTVRWYHNAAIHVLRNTAVINNLIIYNSFNTSKQQVISFLESLSLV